MAMKFKSIAVVNLLFIENIWTVVITKLSVFDCSFVVVDIFHCRCVLKIIGKD
jgi:hypothetical protein